MQTNFSLLRSAVLVIALAATPSCMTTYDANGRPVQSVDPAMAVAGAAAAGVLGYAIANDNNDHHHHHNNNYYYGPGPRPRHGPPPRYYNGRHRR